MQKKFLGVLLAGVSSAVLSAAASAQVTQIADFHNDFASPAAAGWSYLWNGANVTIGHPSQYTALSFNSTDTKYETASTGGLPQANPGGYLSVSSTNVQVGYSAGSNPASSDGITHYAIIAYTPTAQQINADGPGLYFHTYDFAPVADQTLTVPYDIELFKNDTLVRAPIELPAQFSFSDTDFGQDFYMTDMTPGDTFYIAIGQPGPYAGENVGVSFTLALGASGVPEPVSMSLIVMASLGMLRRRR